ncbi:FemAB family PEP-CTERM system-associated protein [Thalassotalea nanhaiensis]|uniref:FemAB family PEP-CTERM system-associated protein n=1 Tax=Thalassotalea nanhaiensis TaxID=3065648 RepID=A0ABY9TI67_9GAMM|nr:FemAB family PEP-CTERM system-associated protein [Colwelliaceae bacterium SQ345]
MVSNYRIEQLSPKDFDKWDHYAQQHAQFTIYHLTEWQQIIGETFNHSSCYIIAFNCSGQVKGILPMINLSSTLFGNHMLSLPYFNYGGALSDCEEVRELLIDKAIEWSKTYKVKHLQLRDTLPVSNKLLTLNKHKVNMVLSLPKTNEQLQKIFSSKLKSQIKRATKEEVQVEFGHLDLLDDFYRVFCEKMRDLGTPVYSKLFFENMLNAFPKASLITVIYWQGKPVSAGFVFFYNRKFEVPWAATLSKANHISVNMLLYWKMIERAIDYNCLQFDFGRCTVDSGTFRFKKQWGAIPKQCYWYNWAEGSKGAPDLSPANPRFNLAIKVWKKLPLLITNRLGPVIVKNLP